MPHAVHFAGSRARTLVAGEETDGAFALLLLRQAAASATPPHRHRRESETACVLAGALTLEAGGELLVLGSGEAATLPPDCAHRLSNRASGPVDYLLLCAPAGFERFVAEAGVRGDPADDEARPATAEEERRGAELAPRFGIDLVDEGGLAGPVRAQRAAPEAVDVIGIVIEVLAELGAGRRDPVALQATVPPGGGVPVHRHPEPEWFYVVEGRLDVYVEGTWTSGEAGALLPVPGNALHAIRNAGTAPARTICVTTAPLLNFFRAAGSPVGAEPPGPPSAERIGRLVAVATAHGQWIGGPQEQAAAGLA